MRRRECDPKQPRPKTAAEQYRHRFGTRRRLAADRRGPRAELVDVIRVASSVFLIGWCASVAPRAFVRHPSIVREVFRLARDMRIAAIQLARTVNHFLSSTTETEGPRLQDSLLSPLRKGGSQKASRHHRQY